MRRLLLASLMFCGSLQSAPCAAQAKKPPAAEVETDAPVEPPNLPPFKVNIDKSKVDLDKRRLVLSMTRPAARVELKLYADSGEILAEISRDFKGQRAGAPLLVSWPDTEGGAVAKLELFAYDIYDYFKGVAIVPWSFSIPHEEVTFALNSAEIKPTEEPKLEASLSLIQEALAKHQKLGRISLFIAGHTDTTGKPAHNRQLSQKRARAIALWFREHGLTLPIAYEGFGDRSLKVPTADEVDEPQNRRVDYVLSIEEPRFKSSGGRPAWKQI